MSNPGVCSFYAVASFAIIPKVAGVFVLRTKMKLKEITIENFRCFEKLTFDLHPELTVLTALNGGGKTTLIDALRIAVWPFVKGFDLGSQTGKSATIQIENVRVKEFQNSMEPQVPAVVEAAGFWPMQNQSDIYFWSQRREKIKKGTGTLSDKQTSALTKHAGKIQGLVRSDEMDKDGQPLSLPLIVYLGTGRLWYQGRYNSEVDDSELEQTAQSRLWAYQNCLTATSSYKQFESWFSSVFKGFRELQIEKLEGKNPDREVFEGFENAIAVVQKAINEFTEEETGWKDLQYRASQNQQLVMHHSDHGYVPLSQLSDGLRNMVVMISDIAFRCFKLNPHFGCEAASKTEGLALIDEVDMFLHPSWQQRVMPALRKAFPNIQFVVTTHSPQVLSTVPAECIRVLDNYVDVETGEIVSAVKTLEQQTIGTPSSDILLDYQNVNPIPPVAEAQWVAEYTALIEQNRHASEEAVMLRKKLLSTYGASHRVMLDADKLIRFQSLKQKMKKA